MIVVVGPIVRVPPTFTATPAENVIAAASVKSTVASLSVRAVKDSVAVVPALNVPKVATAPTVTVFWKVSVTTAVLAVKDPPVLMPVVPWIVCAFGPSLNVPPATDRLPVIVVVAPIVNVPPALTVTLPEIVGARLAKSSVASLSVNAAKDKVVPVPRPKVPRVAAAPSVNVPAEGLRAAHEIEARRPDRPSCCR